MSQIDSTPCVCYGSFRKRIYFKVSAGGEQVNYTATAHILLRLLGPKISVSTETRSTQLRLVCTQGKQRPVASCGDVGGVHLRLEGAGSSAACRHRHQSPPAPHRPAHHHRGCSGPETTIGRPSPSSYREPRAASEKHQRLHAACTRYHSRHTLRPGRSTLFCPRLALVLTCVVRRVCALCGHSWFPEAPRTIHPSRSAR